MPWNDFCWVKDYWYVSNTTVTKGFQSKLGLVLNQENKLRITLTIFSHFIPLKSHAFRHNHTHSDTLTQTKTFTHTHTQTHPDTLTHTDTHSRTPRHTQTDWDTLTHTQTHGHTLTHRQTHTTPGTLRHTQTHSYTLTHIQTNLHTPQAHSDTPRHTHTPSDTDTIRHTQRHSHTPRHRHTQTYSVSHTDTHSRTLRYTHTEQDTITYTHTHPDTHRHPHTVTLWHNHTHIQTYLHTHSHTLVHTFTQTQTHSHTGTLCDWCVFLTTEGLSLLETKYRDKCHSESANCSFCFRYQKTMCSISSMLLLCLLLGQSDIPCFGCIRIYSCWFHSNLQDEKNTEIITVSLMHETGRNLHFYSDIWISTNCIYSNQHTSAIVSNYHFS